MQLLSYARDRLHRTDLHLESDHRLVPGFRTLPLRPPQAAKLYLLYLLSDALLQQTQQDFYAGNFWDLRATGYKLQNPAAEQAQGPPVDPNEMALPDPGCLVYRLSQRLYRTLFETVWGVQAFRIQWPADVEQVYSTPALLRQTIPSPSTSAKWTAANPIRRTITSAYP